MLYPLSYGGGGVIVQVRGYFACPFRTVPVEVMPSACP